MSTSLQETTQKKTQEKTQEKTQKTTQEKTQKTTQKTTQKKTQKTTQEKTQEKIKPKGVALLTVLLAVLLMTVFVSEAFFDMGLEIRALRSQQESQKSSLAVRSALRALTQAMQLDEVLFFSEFARLQALIATQQLRFGSVVIRSIQIQPLDHLYNLNELSSLQSNSDRDNIRWELFLATMQDIPLPTDNADFPETMPEYTIAQLYASIADWTDSDNNEYNGASGASGAEQDSYSFDDFPVDVKNDRFDQLNEVRLLRGVIGSGLPFGVWSNYFTALPLFGNRSWFLPERINVNIASQQGIAEHLKRREFTSSLSSNDNILTRNGILPYVDRAEEIATALLSQEEMRPVYTVDSLSKALAELGFDDNFGINYLFSTINTYYFVSLVADSDGIESQIDAIVQIPREPDSRIALSSKVLSLELR